MKKTQLILAAAALVALASCSNIEPVNQTRDNEIGFNAVTRLATRANDAIINGTTYGTDNTFKVWGWQSQEGDFSEFATNDASNFMTNLKIEWTKGRDNTRDLAWRNATNYYYWPFTGKISFLAVHPYEVTPTTTGWDATNKKPQAKIDGYSVAGKDSTDLMFATAEGARRADGLPMVFKHALSQIQFRVRTDYDYTKDTVVFKVNSVAINNIDLSGDVAYVNDVITWSENTDQVDTLAYYNQPDTVVYAASDADAQLYGRALVVIPQDANVDRSASDSTTITISYTMKQKSYAEITGKVTVVAPWAKVKEKNGEVITPYDPATSITGWEAGKKYNYTLCFKLNEITFNPSVTDWVEVDVQTINILD